MLLSSERDVIESSTTRMLGARPSAAASILPGAGAAVDAVQLAIRPAGFKTTKTVPSRKSAPPDICPEAGQGIPSSWIKASFSDRNSSIHTAHRLDSDFNNITDRMSE